MEFEFCARVHAGAHRRPIPNLVTDSRGPRGGLSWQQLHILHHLGNPGLLQLCRPELPIRRQQKEEQNAT
jgi:hypothetical protein